ncbi:hypothetical protein CHARACLAT_009253 [Characodon lateralis]|uniref:Uncharacterized protein n=1 Tax=Characodon lateralis TaxID=208331 RepID=A0ABU7EHU3_9TELE|nr:hypothetical protein [Characodon lateralis]
MERFIEIAAVGHSHTVQNQSEREKTLSPFSSRPLPLPAVNCRARPNYRAAAGMYNCKNALEQFNYRTCNSMFEEQPLLLMHLPAFLLHYLFFGRASSMLFPRAAE